MSATITAKIPRKGISTGEKKISFEVNGATGESCTNLTASFENALSQTPAEQTLKPEFYETEQRREFLSHGDDVG
jgi:hypothetical protein